MIDEFKDNFEFLSNFYISPLQWDGYSWLTVEHIYQAVKTFDLAERQSIRRASTCKEAKYLGYKVLLRPDWEKVKFNIMYELIRLKFFPGTDLAKKLLATGQEILIEGNYWHDNTWGNCYCKKCKDIEGGNNLGFILMLVRKELKDV